MCIGGRQTPPNPFPQHLHVVVTPLEREIREGQFQGHSMDTEEHSWIHSESGRWHLIKTGGWSENGRLNSESPILSLHTGSQGFTQKTGDFLKNLTSTRGGQVLTLRDLPKKGWVPPSLKAYTQVLPLLFVNSLEIQDRRDQKRASNMLERSKANKGGNEHLTETDNSRSRIKQKRNR